MDYDVFIFFTWGQSLRHEAHTGFEPQN